MQNASKQNKLLLIILAARFSTEVEKASLRSEAQEKKKIVKNFPGKSRWNIDFAGVLVMKILYMIVFFEGFITNVYPRKQE